MPPVRKRPQVRYHGLRNQGATCYLNSVLQVLFMTKDYRDAVKRHSSENGDTEFIDHHLSTLFDDLQDRTSNTKEITHKLGIDTVYEQRDAAEYYEKILNLTNPDASQIFHGQLTHKTICSSCGDEADSDAAFWHLPLTLVDPHSESYSVDNGIKEYFKDADFSGENQMYCDLCDDKSDATIKCFVKHHPEVLMLLLKRFEFNFNYMTYVKNNCTVEVPYTLEIPQTQMYKLYAVVEHFGDLRSGHYTAIIKSQDDGRWYTFDDTEVSLNDYQPFQVDQSETSNSAYLLFYRKINVHADDTCNPNISEMSSPEDLRFATSNINGQLKEESEEAEQVSNDTAQDEMNEEQRRVEDLNTEKVEKTRDDEESEKKEKSVTDYPDMDAEYQDKVALSDNGLYTNEILGGSREVEQHHDLQPVSVNKQGDQKRMEEVDEKGKNRVDEMEGPKNKKLYTKYDLYLGTVGDDKQNMSKDDEKCKDRNISSYEREGQQRRDKGDDKKVEKQVRGDDTDPQRKGPSDSQHEYDQDGDQSNRRLGDTAQNKPEGKLSSTHTGHEGASVVRQNKRQQNKNGLVENPEVGSVKKRRREESPVHFDDSCNPNISEMSSPEDLPSATSDINDQLKEESEEAEQVSNDITASFSINGNVETETETEGLPSETHSNVESHNNKTSNSQENNEKKNEPSYNPHDVHTEMTMTDTDVRGKAEADDEAKSRENLGTKDGVNTGGQGPQPDTHSDEESHNNKTSSQENNEERTDSSCNPQDDHPETILNDKDIRGKVETDDEEKERENLSKENPLDERVEDQENDSEREKTADTKLTVSDEHVIQGHLNKQGEMNEEQRRVEDLNTEKVEKTRDDEESEKKEKSVTEYPDRDAEYQDKAALSDNGLNINENLGGSQEVKQYHHLQSKDGNSSSYEREGQQRGDKGDDKEVKEQIRDTDTQRKGPSESQHEYDQNGDQSNRRLGDTAQNKAEGKLSSSHTGHEGASVLRQTKEQQNEKDKDAESEADSPHRQEGSAGSRGLVENQETGSVKKRRREDSPVHADNNCNPNISEMSSPEDLPSATSDINDQLKEESEEAEQVSNDITASFSINGNVETETETETEGLPPDTHSNMESHNNKTSNSQESNKEKNEPSYNPHNVHTEMTMTDTDVRGKAEADDEVNKREKLGNENPLDERVEDQKNDSEREKTADTKLTVSDEHVIQGHPYKQDEMNEEQMSMKDVNTEKIEKTRDDEESEKKEKSVTEYPDRDAEYQDKAALSDNGLNINENLGGSQEVKQYHDLQSKDGNSSSYEREGQQRGDKGDDKEVKEQIRDTDTQRKGPSESQHEYDQNGDQSNRRLGDTAQNKAEGKLSSSHTGHEGASAVRQTKEQQNEKDKDAESEADSPHRQEGSAGSRGLVENQETGSVEIRRREDSQPKGKETFNKERVGEISGSKKSKSFRDFFSSKKRKSHQKNDPEVRSLTESLNKLSLSDSGSLEQQERLLEKSARKENREFDTQQEDSKRKVKTPGCLPFSLTRGKKSKQTSEQD